MFKDFDLPILFDISTTKSVDKNKLDFVDDGEYDFIGRTSVDWGIQGKLHKLSFEPNPKDSFSLIQVGETVALWREREWYASQNLFLLNPRIEKIKENKLYFQGAINKEMSRYGKEYNSYPTMKSLVVTKIVLPVIGNPNPDHKYTVDDIDWQYMRERITELERERITELDAYLQATGLNDYELTEDDKKILSLSVKKPSNEEETLEDDSEDSVRLEKFFLHKIADLHNGNKFDKNKMTYNNPSVNFVSRTASNNGVSGFVDNNGTEPYKAGCITLAFGGSIGSCFVQYAPFYTGQNVGVIDFSDDVSFEAKQYIALTLGKYCQAMFTAFADEINKHFKKDLEIYLPAKSDRTPDFDYMERYIRAIEKVVIVDVVRYKDKVIETTKKVVGE